MIYAQGTRHGTGVSTSGAYDYTSHNVSALQTAPPVKPHVGCGILTLIGFGSFFISIFGGAMIIEFLYQLGIWERQPPGEVSMLRYYFFLDLALMIALSAGSLILSGIVISRQMPAYNARLREWSLSMMCRRCGYAWFRKE